MQTVTEPKSKTKTKTLAKADTIRARKDVKTKVEAKVVTPESTLAELLSKPFLDKCEALTDREAEIVVCIWKGYRNSEIADALKISSKTVEAHRAHVMLKYRCTNVIQMIRVAMAKGVIKV